MFIGGLVGGFFSGLLGIGGGIFYVVIFSDFIARFYGNMGLLESDEVKMVISNSIFATMFAAFAGCIKQIRVGNFYPQMVLKIGIPAVIFSNFCSYLLSSLEYSKTHFSILFILLLLPLLFKMLFDDQNKKQFNNPKRIKPGFLYLLGAFSGSMTAFSGLGGGFAIIPFLNSLYKIKIRKVISISLGVIFCVAFTTSIFNLCYYESVPNISGSVGKVLLNMTFPVIIGVFLSAPVGVLASKRMSPTALRILFVLVCLFITLKTILELYRKTF